MSEFNREHLYESRKPWDSVEHTRRVRRFTGHILPIPIETHQRMNRDLGDPDFALMSLRMANLVMSWAQGQDIRPPLERFKFIQEEELYYRRLGAFQRARPLGREAIYFADCLEMKIPYYKEASL